MQLPIVLDGSEKATLQNQIFDQIRSMIIRGQLKIGDPLPATRELSSQTGVSRNTAVLAYERLIAEGYVQTRPYVGTYVAATAPHTKYPSAVRCDFDSSEADRRSIVDESNDDHAAPPRIHSLVNRRRRRLIADFWVGRSDPNSFPLKAWSQLIWNRLKTAGAALTEYNDPAGLPELRQAIADHLGPARGVIAEPDQVVIVGGCQDGFNLLARLLVRPGSPAVVESPCYQGAAYVLESFGAQLYPVPVDHEGLDVAKLPQVEGAVAYVTPSHQYPTGVTLSLRRRIALLSWATEHGAYVVEDDYDSDFRFVGSPFTALKGLDRGERVIYMGTFSKCMGPGLRLGYVVLPRRLVDGANRLKTLMNNGQGWLEQAAMADFMASGGFGRHLRRIRQLYHSRRDALLAAMEKHFGACEVLGDQGGMHLAWRLPEGFPKASDVEARALDAGVGVYALAAGAAIHFGPDDESDRFLVLGFAALTEREIEAGVARLASALQGDRRPRDITAAMRSKQEAL
ncbi:MAG: transcriptional regulator [Methylocystaceae bacterium]|nr:MAG: transcriptional regulator [Methylocystaceae bacterium]